MRDNIAKALDQLDIEIRRLYAKAEIHRRATNERLAAASALEKQRKDLAEAASARRQAVIERLEVRKTERALRQYVVASLSAPAKVGGINQITRWRVIELSKKLKEAATPIPKQIGRSGVYVLFDGDDIVYIGQATNILRRLADHMGRKRFTHACYINCRPEELSRLERTLIDLYTPEFNSDGRTRVLKERRQTPFVQSQQETAG